MTDGVDLGVGDTRQRLGVELGQPFGDCFVGKLAVQAGPGYQEPGRDAGPHARGECELIRQWAAQARVGPVRERVAADVDRRDASDLTALLREHLDEHGTTPDGRLFRGVRGGPLSESLYGRLWALVRAAALTAQEVASPLARRPYDLRHAAVSTWLNGGVPAPQAAAWAGHSVDVLLRAYAKCIVGQDAAVRRRVEEALRAGS